MAAAIGLVQLGRLGEWTCKRVGNALYFNQHIESVKTPPVIEGNTHVYHQYTVRVPEGVDRDAVSKRLNERGIGVRVYYPLPIHKQPVFQAMDGYKDVVLPETEKATREVFSMPVHPALTEEERAYIVQEVNAAC
jgi:dTDP-4-amino-4,6-dideoxygalactose transaminase